MKARKGIKEGFRNTKDTYYDNGINSFEISKSLKDCKMSLEKFCNFFF